MLKNILKNKELLSLTIILLCLILLAPIVRYTDLHEGLFSDHSDYLKVQGTVVESSSKFVLGGGAKSTGGYKLNIVYEYKVDGVDYRSDKYSFGQSKFHSKMEADKIVSQYRAGDKVPVYVSKDDTEIAVLNIEDNSNVDFILLFLLTLAISAYAGRDFYLRNKKTSKKRINSKSGKK